MTFPLPIREDAEINTGWLINNLRISVRNFISIIN